MAFITALRARWRTVSADRQDLAFALLLTLSGTIEALADHASGSRLVTALTMIGLGVAVALRRRNPLVAVALANGALIVGFVLGGFALDAGFTGFLVVVVVVYSVAAYSDGPALWAGVAVQAVSFSLEALVFSHGDRAGNLVFGLVMACGIPVAAGLSMRNRRRLVAELRQRSEQLVAERERRADRAVAAERARIAGELHDVVSHNVSVMVVQAGAARRLVSTDPARASEAMLAIETTGRAALDEMRRLLGVLRHGDEALALTPQPTLQRVDRLVEIARGNGLDASLLVEGEPATLPLGLDVAAYRIVQEALTSAQAHAPGSRAQVVVRYGRSELEIEVLNGAGADHEPGSRPASVLVGLRERVALFGGEVHAGRRRGGGYAMRARLPLEAQS